MATFTLKAVRIAAAVDPSDAGRPYLFATDANGKVYSYEGAALGWAPLRMTGDTTTVVDFEVEDVP